jgi:hypothetical protein
MLPASITDDENVHSVVNPKLKKARSIIRHDDTAPRQAIMELLLS